MNKGKYDEMSATICAMDSLIDQIIATQATLICQNNKKYIFEASLHTLNKLSSLRTFLDEMHELIQDKG